MLTCSRGRDLLHGSSSILLCTFFLLLCINPPPLSVQEYSSVKWAEHALKSLRYDGNSVSVVDPETYANRFTSFMRQKVFQ